MENLFIPNIPYVTDMFIGNTTFRQAIIDNKVTIVKDLLDKQTVGVNDTYIMQMRAIHYACQYGRFEILNQLLERGADVHVKDSYIGYTPLHWAAEGGYVSLVELLIEKGQIQNLDEKDGINSTFSDTYTGTHAFICS